MRIGTRASALALAQTRLVAASISDTQVLTTDQLGGTLAAVAKQSGGTAKPPPMPTDKSRWVATLERALQSDVIDLAVHSAKDLPGRPTAGLTIHATPQRGPCEDVLIVRESAFDAAVGFDALQGGARVGTSSLRRAAQIRAARPDVQVIALAGNIDTRIARLHDSQQRLDAIVLAAAGLERLGISGLQTLTLDPHAFIPAPGQGTLALQGRIGDVAAEAAARKLDDASTHTCLRAERALAERLDATCNTPLGALARLTEPASTGDVELTLTGWLGLPDGSVWLRDELSGALQHPQQLGAALAERMLKAGAAELLAEAETMVLAGA